MQFDMYHSRAGLLNRLVLLSENLQSQCRTRHEHPNRSRSDKASASSEQSHMGKKLDSLTRQKEMLDAELHKLESEISLAQNDIDALARRNGNHEIRDDIESPITGLEKRIQKQRERLSRGLAELLIRTDGEFIYMTLYFTLIPYIEQSKHAKPCLLLCKLHVPKSALHGSKSSELDTEFSGDSDGVAAAVLGKIRPRTQLLCISSDAVDRMWKFEISDCG